MKTKQLKEQIEQKSYDLKKINKTGFTPYIKNHERCSTVDYKKHMTIEREKKWYKYINKYKK